MVEFGSSRWSRGRLKTLFGSGATGSSVQGLVHMGELGLGGCLADDMGLGKTVQALALLAAPGRGALPR